MEPGEIARGAARGAIAAMAMTGMRSLTTRIGLVRRTPPYEIAEHGVPRILATVPRARRDEAIELAHWAYGAGAGAAFGALPPALRARTWAGPAYGIAIWAFFEVVVARALRLPRTRERRLGDRVGTAADHLLYGAVLVGWPRPPDVPSRSAEEGRAQRQ